MAVTVISTTLDSSIIPNTQAFNTLSVRMTEQENLLSANVPVISSVVASNVVTVAALASNTERQDTLETTFNGLIINAGSSNAEIVAARGSAVSLPVRLSEVDTQLADNATQMKDYGFNLDNTHLAHYRNAVYPKIVFWGDSITAGSGATTATSDYVNQFKDVLQIAKGMYGMGLFNPNNGIYNVTAPSGWTIENKGTNQGRLKSGVGGADLSLIVHNLAPQKTDIIYSVETDGGSFDVLVAGVSVQTVSCNGAHSYHNKVVGITTTAGQTLAIHPHTDEIVYIEGYVAYATNGATDGALVYQVGHPGNSAGGYADDEIVACISSFNPDLTIISMIMNDYASQNPTLYSQKIEKAIQEGLKSGDVILMPPAQSGASLNTPLTHTWAEYVGILQGLAKQYNVGFLDINAYWGGFTKADATGFYSADKVHPSQLGHDSIAKLLFRLLLPYANPTLRIRHDGDSTNYYDIIMQYLNNIGVLKINHDIEVQSIGGYAGTPLNIKNMQLPRVTTQKSTDQLVQYQLIQSDNKVGIIQLAYENMDLMVNGIAGLRVDNNGYVKILTQLIPPVTAPVGLLDGQIWWDDTAKALKVSVNGVAKTVTVT